MIEVKDGSGCVFTLIRRRIVRVFIISPSDFLVDEHFKRLTNRRNSYFVEKKNIDVYFIVNNYKGEAVLQIILTTNVILKKPSLSSINDFQFFLVLYTPLPSLSHYIRFRWIRKSFRRSEFTSTMTLDRIEVWSFSRFD